MTIRTGRRRAISLAPFLVFLFLTGNASAHSYQVGAILIGHLWARPPVNGELRVFGPLFNSGAMPDRLTKAASPIAKSAGFANGDTTAPKIVGSIDLPPGHPVSLAAWRAHIVLRDLKQRVKTGDLLPLTLFFEQAGSIDVSVLIENKSGH